MSRYFARYSGVKQFMESMKRLAKEHGCVETLLRRQIIIPDIYSADQKKRARAERVAINAPIQGSAADIIKIAMARINSQVVDTLKATMLLQIHDELLFEVEEKDLEHAARRIKEIMELRPTPTFDVPLVVDVEAGPSYGELQTVKLQSNL